MRWLLLDRLVECVPGQRAVAVKTFPRSDLLFMDHFADLPTVPGVLLIEMIAQTGGKCVRLARPGCMTYLGVVRSAKFFRRVEPGDRCRVCVEIIQLGEAHALESGVVEVDGGRVAQAEIVAAIVAAPGPFEDPILRDWQLRQAGQSEHDSVEARVDAAAR